MTTTNDRHRVLRHAITATVSLTGAVRRGQSAAVSGAVWRVIEPQLVQRDAQLDAVREVVAAMDGVTGARFWSEQLRAALRPQPPAAATTQPPLTWCAASMRGVGGEPIGPCVLRAGHDGPVHQAADGARFWTAEEAAPEPVDWATVPLTVKVYGAGPQLCESGRHTAHPGDTCEEADGVATAWRRWFETWAQAVGYHTQPHTPPSGLPAALRGPAHPGTAGDPTPLRRLAERAFTDHQEQQP